MPMHLAFSSVINFVHSRVTTVILQAYIWYNEHGLMSRTCHLANGTLSDKTMSDILVQSKDKIFRITRANIFQIKPFFGLL